MTRKTDVPKSSQETGVVSWLTHSRTESGTQRSFSFVQEMVQVRTRDVPFRTQIRIPCVEDTVEQNAVGRLRQDVRHFSDCRSARCDVGVDGATPGRLVWFGMRTCFCAHGF